MPMGDTIRLGGRAFDLRPLKLGQLRHVLDALDGMAGKSGGALVEAAAGVVAAGVSPAHPGVDGDTILDLEATLEELNAAVAAVLQAAGLRPVGEQGPVAKTGDGSATSTPLSPPAAVMATVTSTT